MIDRRALLGMALVCSAASIGGLTVVMTRFVITETDPFTLASVRYLLASTCLIALVLYQGKRFGYYISMLTSAIKSPRFV